MDVKPITKLVSKTTNIGIKEFSLQDLAKGIKIPQRAATFDIVKIKKGDDKDITILSFREKGLGRAFGNLISRYIISVCPKSKKITKRDYKNIKESTINGILSFNQDLTFQVLGRKISSITKLNDQFCRKSEVVQTITKTKDKDVLHISKVCSKPGVNKNEEIEEQSFYRYVKGEKRKGYKVSDIVKYKNFFFADNMMSFIKFEGFKPNSIKNMLRDPYLLTHLYSLKQFKRMAPALAYNPQHKPKNLCSIKWYNSYNTDNRGRCINGSEIELNNRILNNRNDIIESAAHEHEHCFQYEQANLYKDYKNLVKYNLQFNSADLIEDIDKAEIYYKEFKNYNSSEDGYDKYLSQTIEQEARRAGFWAKIEYNNFLRRFRNEFPYAPEYVIGLDLQHKDITDFILAKRFIACVFDILK